MSEPRQTNKAAVALGAIMLFVIAAPLWREFRVAGDAAWNIFLAIFLIGLGASAFVLGRYFYVHSDEIGEARFDTRNKVDR